MILGAGSAALGQAPEGSTVDRFVRLKVCTQATGLKLQSYIALGRADKSNLAKRSDMNPYVFSKI